MYDFNVMWSEAGEVTPNEGTYIEDQTNLFIWSQNMFFRFWSGLSYFVAIDIEMYWIT